MVRRPSKVPAGAGAARVGEGSGRHPRAHGRMGAWASNGAALPASQHGHFSRGPHGLKTVAPREKASRVGQGRLATVTTDALRGAPLQPVCLTHVHRGSAPLPP